jgi:hypothetical protein
MNTMLKLFGLFLTAIGCVAIAVFVALMCLLAVRYVLVAIAVVVFVALIALIVWALGIQIYSYPRI